MSTASSGATPDYSNGPAASRGHRRAAPRPRPGRLLLAAAGLAGVVLVLVSTASTIVRITVGGSSELAGFDTSLTGWDRHGPALVIVAVFALVLLGGALRGAAPAMLALALCGALVIGIVLATDAAALDETGAVSQAYEDARAQAGTGFFLETAGGVLVLLSGGGLAISTVGRSGRDRERRRPRAGA